MSKREVGQEALVRVNQRAIEAKRSAGEGGERRRINFGVYFYETTSDPTDESNEGDD